MEFRLHYHLQGIEPDRIQPLAPNLSYFDGIGADLIVSPPFIPVGVGLRYEALGSAGFRDSFGRIESNFNRLSGLVSYRVLDTFIYLGLIGTIGFDVSGETTLSSKGQADQKLKVDADGSFSVGIEGGVKALICSLGAEIGYMVLEDKGVAPSQDYGGVYSKIHFSLGF